MKITIHELLRLINDGKAPKEIKYEDRVLEYNEELEDYNYYYNKGLFEYKFETSMQFLDDEIEIIEELNKIEKITVREKTLGFPNGEWTARNMDKAFAIKINEIIDEINKLKEND